MEEIFSVVLNNFIGYLIVLVRISGIFTFNPIFSRTNTPAMARAMMALTLSAMMFVSMGGTTGYVPQSVPGLFLIILTELFIGFVFGVMTNLILTVLIFAGELIDNQIGLGMAKAMDPATGIQMPIFANMLNYIFIVYFFSVGGHLDYIRLFWLSFDLIPIGYAFSFNTIRMTIIITDYLSTVMELAMKLAMPVIAAELIVEFCIGIIMKAVPSIQVVVLNIQLKVLIGLLVIMAITSPISEFFSELFGIMRTNLYNLAEGFI